MTAKQIRALTALLLALVMILSVSFIALNAHHNCSGEDCRICAQIRACEDLLRDLLRLRQVCSPHGLSGIRVSLLRLNLLPFHVRIP